MYFLLGAIVAAFGLLTTWGGLSGNEANMIAAAINPQSLSDATTGKQLGQSPLAKAVKNLPQNNAWTDTQKLLHWLGL